VRTVQAELHERGRVLIRPSGTEPVIRVMVEAPTRDGAEEVAARLCESVERALGVAGAP
jgi:phosphoglucosamine mutase